MHEIILHLGSNQGDRDLYLNAAIQLIGQNIGEIIKESNTYETEPWGILEQNDFLNKALLLCTTLTPREVILRCLEIETKLGRKRAMKWGPRIIDIDIIFYGQIIIDSEELCIPHPRMHEREFVLLPLLDIIPEWEHPVLCKTIRELHASLSKFELIIQPS